jgi:CheY-like chemotaxis protein
MTEEPKRRIALVVDDEHFARLYVLQILLDLNFVVLEACDSSEAWEMLCQNEDTTVLITDVRMPGELNGIELAKRAKAANPDLGIIFVSGLAPPPRLPSPDHAFVAKPYTPRALLEALVHVWGPEALPQSVPLAMTALGSIAAV